MDSQQSGDIPSFFDSLLARLGRDAHDARLAHHHPQLAPTLPAKYKIEMSSVHVLLKLLLR